ncbi:MAG: hypothetical protein AVDCRST_MAG04-1470, partial [uncultured Acetobacteraceae bacterium]
ADPDRRRRDVDRLDADRQPGTWRALRDGAGFDDGRSSGAVRISAAGARAARHQPPGRQQRRGRGARALQAVGRAVHLRQWADDGGAEGERRCARLHPQALRGPNGAAQRRGGARGDEWRQAHRRARGLRTVSRGRV